MTTDCLHAAGGPRGRGLVRGLRRNQRIPKSRWTNVDGFNLGIDEGIRPRRNLANVFPFVGGERGQVRDIDPVIHHARHEEHANHVAQHIEHLAHNEEHPGHHGRQHDQHHEAHHGHNDPNHENLHGHHEDHHGHHEHHEEPGFEPVSNTIFDSRSARQRNRNGNNNEVSLDIGSIAAAGERCIDKVVMVQETEYDDVITCKHSYTERCHTTYITDFEPQQEEECEENYRKNCFIEYKKVAGKETVEFCHTPLVCEGEGPVECKTVYESQCATRYQEHDVEDDIVECETVQEEKCEDVTQGYTTEQKCTKWPREVCEKTTESVKKYSPETDCKKVPRQLCGPSGCQLTAGPEECFDRQETVVQEVCKT